MFSELGRRIKSLKWGCESAICQLFYKHEEIINRFSRFSQQCPAISAFSVKIMSDFESKMSNLLVIGGGVGTLFGGGFGSSI